MLDGPAGAAALHPHEEPSPKAEAPAAPPGRRPRLAVALPDLVVLGVLGLFTAASDWRFRHFWLDDPFISFRYARNLVDGHGLVYNVGEHVEGYSNLSWTLLSAVPIALGRDPLTATRLLGALLHVATVVVVFVGVRRCRPTGTLVPATLAAGFVASSSWFALWSVSGLETPLFAFTLTAAAVAYQQDRTRLAAILLLVASLTRVEGVLFGVAFAVVLVRQRGTGTQVRRTLAWLFGPYLLVLVARVAFYGHALPNSYTAKTGLSTLAAFRAGVGYCYRYLVRGLGFDDSTLNASNGQVAVAAVVLVVAAAGLLVTLVRLRSTASAAHWLAGASLLGVLGITTLGGGDWMPSARFLVPAVSLAALLLGVGAARVADHSGSTAGTDRRSGTPARAALAGLYAVLLVVLLVTAHGQHREVLAAIHRYQPPGTPDVSRNPNYEAMANYLTAHAAPGNLVAIEEAGEIPYRTPQLRYLDLFGLTDERMARAPGAPPFDKHDDAYVLRSAPRFVVVWGLPDGRGSFRWSHQLSLVRRPEFRADYRPVYSQRKEVRYTFIVFERRADASRPAGTHAAGDGR